MTGYSKSSKLNINRHVANEISSGVAQSISLSEMENFQYKYSEIVQEYQNSPALKVLSVIRLDKLESFQNWLLDLQNSKAIAVPLLVSNMLMGDIFALNAYDNIHRSEPNLVITYRKIHQDDRLHSHFNDYGAAEDARAIITAEHWLASEEAVKLLGSSDSGKIALCSANQMLSISNEFIDC